MAYEEFGRNMIYVAGCLLGLVFLVETFVWYIRSMSESNYRSKVISTSNIIMYLTRVLLIGYQIILNYEIETGGDVRQVILSGFIGMSFAVFSHLLIFTNHSILQLFWNIFYKTFAKFRLINPHEYCQEVHLLNKKFVMNLVVSASFVSTVSLLFVYILPQIFATLFFNYRLTLSSVGQVISFFGMIVTLFILDPQLFKMQDAGEIKIGFSYYLHGRIYGLAAAATLLAISIFLI